MGKEYSIHSPKRGNGLRQKPYWIKGKWNYGETTTIRIPVALKEELLEYARELDKKADDR